MRPIVLEPGARFGRLTFVRDTGEYRHTYRVGLFRCDCGRETKTYVSYVKNGKTKSCGCAAGEKHGMTKTPEYRSWRAMWQRCHNPNAHAFDRYGGRGVTVCERWRSFEAFYADMGPRPLGTTLDRFPNNDGNYEPGNCRWATREQQRANRRAK